jgi:predicted DNA-binding transcriptional regulator AlpA
MTQHFSPQDTLLSTEELAQKTGFTQRFWEGRRLSGDTPPFIRLGFRAVRYRWEDVSKWLADRLRTSTSDHGELNSAHSENIKGDTI